MWRLYEKVLRCAFKLSQSQRASRSLAKTGLFLGILGDIFQGYFSIPFLSLFMLFGDGFGAILEP